ncbi:hypothetical protein PTKIN_Ptkin05aG0147700 [Pterospermum kingtungense]
MFPSRQNHGYLYEISDIPHYEDFVQEILTSAETSVEGSNLAQKIGKGKGLTKKLVGANNSDGNATGNDAKKIMHKEIERQRRQQMAKLYAKLRSLLPLESIKGKRAVSDHMNEAVNYIKYLKKSIQELSVKRDKIKTLSNLSALDQGNATSSENSTLINSCVAVHSFWGGVEIVINSCFGEDSWHLSTMMEVILEEGLDVVRCVSSQTNRGFLHAIQSEVTDPTQFDLPWLQTKLNDLISRSEIRL